jgi:hypothetical protein
LGGGDRERWVNGGRQIWREGRRAAAQGRPSALTAEVQSAGAEREGAIRGLVARESREGRRRDIGGWGGRGGVEVKLGKGTLIFVHIYKLTYRSHMS